MAKTFDPICYDLAEKFADKESESSRTDFAKYIQDCAEWWMEEHSEAAKARRDRVSSPPNPSKDHL
jgi:hypothetical protein